MFSKNELDASPLFFVQGFPDVARTLWVGNAFFFTTRTTCRSLHNNIIITCPGFGLDYSIAANRNVGDTRLINNALQSLKAAIIWHHFV